MSDHEVIVRSKWSRVMLSKCGKIDPNPSQSSCLSLSLATSNENVKPVGEVENVALEEQECGELENAKRDTVKQLPYFIESQINDSITVDELDVMIETDLKKSDMDMTSCCDLDIKTTVQLSLSDTTPNSSTENCSSFEDEARLESEMDMSAVTVLECPIQSLNTEEIDKQLTPTEIKDDLMQLDFDCSKSSANIFQPVEVSGNVLLLSSFDIHVNDTPKVNIIIDNMKQAHMEAYNILVNISNDIDMSDANILLVLEKFLDEPELNDAYMKLKQVCDLTLNALLVHLVEDYLKDLYILEKPNDMDQNWMDSTKDKICKFLEHMNVFYQKYALDSIDINKNDCKKQITKVKVTVSDESSQTVNEYVPKTDVLKLQSCINTIYLISDALNETIEELCGSKLSDAKIETGASYLYNTVKNRDDLLKLRYVSGSLKHPVLLKPELMAENIVSEQGDNLDNMPRYMSAYKDRNRNNK